MLSVVIEVGEARLRGIVRVPDRPKGFVIFAHGSGSSRLSPRNRQVSRALNQVGLATFLFDLLTDREAEERRNVFDISFLAGRLVLATRWLQKQPFFHGLPIGYFGASTGAAAALWAASELGDEIRAVVSRGGRPDLAMSRLAQVVAPTLLLVGGNDEVVVDLNQEALSYLKVGQLEIVPGASHLFEEPGTLEYVSKRAGEWFVNVFVNGRIAA